VGQTGSSLSYFIAITERTFISGGGGIDFNERRAKRKREETASKTEFEGDVRGKRARAFLSFFLLRFLFDSLCYIRLRPAGAL